MSQGPLQIKIFDKQQLLFEGEFTGAVLLGRQDRGEDLYRCCRVDEKKWQKLVPGDEGSGRDNWKLVVAGWDERNVSRDHAVLEAAAQGRAKVTNVSQTLPVILPAAGDLPKWDGPGTPQPSKVANLPLFINLGPKTVRVQEFEIDDGEGLQSLTEMSRPPGRLFGSSGERFKALREIESTKPGTRGPTADPEALVRMLQDTLGVLQDSSNAVDFFKRAAEALVTSLGLDNGWVMTFDDERNEWIPAATHSKFGVQAEAEQRPSRQFLNKVRVDRKASWRQPGENSGDSNRSLMPMQAVVAAPILDAAGRVVGAVYGDRRQALAGGPTFSKIDALFVEVLAGGVASGLTRLEHEARAKREENQFDQFFGRKLGERLRAKKLDLSKGSDAEITVLFADIRGFSGISERLGHEGTFKWINGVMEKLSQCVDKRDGMTVNYIGDAIMAMWGAPEPNEQQAELACRAALDMQAAVPELNNEWFGQLNRDRKPDEPELKMSLGIGVNTGRAMIGNSGSSLRFNYGPLGNTVNVASRLEGTTKHLRVPVVVSESTYLRLAEAQPGTFGSRRLCCVRVVNIENPVYVYEIWDATGSSPQLKEQVELMAEYERALAAFDAKQFDETIVSLGRILRSAPGDGPSRVLLRRAVVASEGIVHADHPVFNLSDK